MSRSSRDPNFILFTLTVLPENKYNNKTLYFRSNEQARDNPLPITYIGQDEDRDDIVLREYEHRSRCYFTITKAGDLMLCDAGNDLEKEDCHISPMELRVTDSDGPALKFSIRSIGDSCVLPFSRNHEYTIKFPSGEKFAVRWGEGVAWQNLQATRDILREEYRIRSGHGPNADEVRQNLLDYPGKRQIPCSRDPRVRDPKKMYVKDTYRYRLLYDHLWSGVDVAVDLHDGKEYAIKTIRAFSGPTRPSFEDMLSQFRAEVEVGARLNHPYILTPEHHQGWEHLWGPEIFYPLYDGKVSSMMTHKCHKRDVGRHLPNFLVHILKALSFIHSLDMSHGNVGLGNIMFKGEGSSVSFFLSGLRMTSASYSRDWVGDPRYMAPELLDNARRREFNGPPADIYSFGVALLEFLDIIGPRDYECARVRDWRGWQVASGCIEGYDIGHKRFSRVKKSLRKNRLLKNPTLKNMLDPDSLKRPSADQALRELADHYNFEF